MTGVSEDDLLVVVVVGHFNAHVGCGVRGDARSGVRGCHGVGCINENGEALLSWCGQRCVSKKRITSVHMAAPQAVALQY